MGIFKKWFSKQDKNSSLDSNEEEDVDMDAEHHGLLGYIVLGCDLEGEMFVSVRFGDGQELKMAELMFLLVSGQMVEETISSLRKACTSNEQMEFILKALAGYMQEYAAQQNQQKGHRPVIDPTEVFSRREQGDFKG